MGKSMDRSLLITIIALVVIGFFIFVSASLGLLAREGGASFSSVAFNQVFFGIFLGGITLFIVSHIKYRFWRKYALYIFLFSILMTLLVFVPGLGFESGGARRWLSLGPFSFQPSELLKLGFVIYFATWLSGVREKVQSFKYGLLPFMVIMGIVGSILLAQPDTDTLVVIFAAGLAMFIVSGARWRDIGALALTSVTAFAVLAFARPYIMERVLTFLNPTSDPLGSSYQIQQSLIAIGSGQVFGRGFGQSIQKFNFLPEPIGDSIFAVAAEEFGFVGSVALLFLFIFFAVRGLKIATRAPDHFGGLLAVGIVILIISQAFLNIGSMLGVLPLTGLPLLFVSHGGSALLVALAEVGIILNISKYSKKP